MVLIDGRIGDDVRFAIRPAHPQLPDFGLWSEAEMDGIWVLGLVGIASNDLRHINPLFGLDPDLGPNEEWSGFGWRKFHADPMVGGLELVQMHMQAVAS